MRNIRSQADKRGGNYGSKLFVTAVLFVLVLALTVLLVMYMSGYFALPAEPVPDGGIVDGEIVPDTPSEGEEDGPSHPQYPAEEPIYEPLYGEQYSTFRLPRKTEEFAFIEKIIESLDEEVSNRTKKHLQVRLNELLALGNALIVYKKDA